MGSIKDRNGNDLTETEEIKKWQKYTELYKKGLNDPYNHNGVITHLEPDILESEVKWALGIMTMNKASGGDGIPVELCESWLIRKDPDAGKDWRQEEKRTTEDKMVGWHRWLNGHEFEHAPGDGEGPGSLVCCSPWDHKELDTVEQQQQQQNMYKLFI